MRWNERRRRGRVGVRGEEECMWEERRGGEERQRDGMSRTAFKHTSKGQEVLACFCTGAERLIKTHRETCSVPPGNEPIYRSLQSFFHFSHLLLQSAACSFTFFSLKYTHTHFLNSISII